MRGTRPRMTTERHVEREIRENLAVDLEAGLGEAVDELRVVEAERPHGGVQALNPQGAERALAALAVAEGVLVRLLHRLLGNADRVLAAAVIALGCLENFLVLGVRCDATFDANQNETPSVSRNANV